MTQQTKLSAQEERALSLFKKEVGEICASQDWELRLFGSRARGEGDDESDLDLLVVVKNLDERTKIRIWDIAYQLFTSTGVLISPLVLSEQQYQGLKDRERLIALDIEREGIRL